MSMKLRSILFLVQNKDVFNLISSIDEDTVSNGVQIMKRPYSRRSLSGSVISRKRPLHLNGWRVKNKNNIKHALLLNKAPYPSYNTSHFEWSRWDVFVAQGFAVT